MTTESKLNELRRNVRKVWLQFVLWIPSQSIELQRRCQLATLPIPILLMRSRS